MSITKSTFENLHKQYEKLKTICNSKLKSNSNTQTEENATTPCRPAEDINEIFAICNSILKSIQAILKTIDYKNVHFKRLVAMQASIYFEQARILIHFKKVKLAQTILEQTIQLLQNIYNQSEITFLYLRIINYYVYQLIQTNDYNRACQLLDQCETIYKTINRSEIKVYYNTDHFFTDSEQIHYVTGAYAIKELEKLITNNYQHLILIYSRRKINQQDLNDQELDSITDEQRESLDKYEKYHHIVLEREIDYHKAEINLLYWSFKTSQLGNHYLQRNNFQQAQYYYWACTKILNHIEVEFQNIPFMCRTNFLAKQLEQLQYYYADLGMCWLNYVTTLFHVSQIKFIDKQSCANEQLHEFSFIPKHVHSTTKPPLLVNNSCEFKFNSLNLNEIENPIPYEPIENGEQAKQLFTIGYQWLSYCRKIYTYELHPKLFIECMFDLSDLYKYLSFFETNIEYQYNLQKTRVNHLESLNTILSKSQSSNIIDSIDLMHDLIESQISLLNVNLKRLSVLESKHSDYLTRHKIEALTDIRDQFNVSLTNAKNIVGGVMVEEDVGDPKVQVVAESEENSENDENHYFETLD